MNRVRRIRLVRFSCSFKERCDRVPPGRHLNGRGKNAQAAFPESIAAEIPTGGHVMETSTRIINFDAIDYMESILSVPDRNYLLFWHVVAYWDGGGTQH